MAFTGAATIRKVSDNLFRITGLSVGIGTTGTIGLVDNVAAEVQLDAQSWNQYDSNGGTQAGPVTLADSVQCYVIPADAAGAAVEPVAVTKAGTDPTDFLITLTNLDVAASGDLEIYVRFH